MLKLTFPKKKWFSSQRRHRAYITGYVNFFSVSIYLSSFVLVFLCWRCVTPFVFLHCHLASHVTGDVWHPLFCSTIVTLPPMLLVMFDTLCFVPPLSPCLPCYRRCVTPFVLFHHCNLASHVTGDVWYPLFCSTIVTLPPMLQEMCDTLCFVPPL